MRRRGLCLSALLLLAALFSYWQGAKAAAELEKAQGKVYLALKEPIKGGAAQDVLAQFAKEEDSLFPVFWSEEQDVQVKGELLGKERSVRLVRALGNTELLFPGANVLVGQGERGCVISRDVVTDLFGYGDAVGNRIRFSDGSYEILGVLEKEKGVMVLQAAEEEESFDRAAAGDETPKRLQERFESLGGLGSVLEEWNLLYGLAKGMLLLVPLAVAAVLLGGIRKALREASGKKETIFWRLCFWVGLVGIVCGAGMQIHLPSDMIPSTWSDFEFWGNLWREKKEALVFLLAMEKHAPEISYMTGFYQSVGFGAGALLAVAAAAGLRERDIFMERDS